MGWSRNCMTVQLFLTEWACTFVQLCNQPIIWRQHRRRPGVTHFNTAWYRQWLGVVVSTPRGGPASAAEATLGCPVILGGTYITHLTARPFNKFSYTSFPFGPEPAEIWDYILRRSTLPPSSPQESTLPVSALGFMTPEIKGSSQADHMAPSVCLPPTVSSLY